MEYSGRMVAALLFAGDVVFLAEDKKQVKRGLRVLLSGAAESG